MSDLDRWVDVQGPPPPGVRELLDAVREPPEITPELSARLDRAVEAAIAVDRRARSRRRNAWLAVGGGLVAACFALALWLGLSLLRRADDVEVADLPATAPSHAPSPSSTVLPSPKKR